MEIVFDNEKKKILSETAYDNKDCFYNNTIVLLNMGDHATHKIRDSFDKIPDTWKTAELSMINSRKGEAIETKAAFLYRAMQFPGDYYNPLRIIISRKNCEQTSEESRIIFYDRNGIVEEDLVTINNLTEKAAEAMPYILDEKTGNYVNNNGEVYRGDINNNDILDKIFQLTEQAEKSVSPNNKSL